MVLRSNGHYVPLRATLVCLPTKRLPMAQVVSHHHSVYDKILKHRRFMFRTKVEFNRYFGCSAAFTARSNCSHEHSKNACTDAEAIQEAKNGIHSENLRCPCHGVALLASPVYECQWPMTIGNFKSLLNGELPMQWWHRKDVFGVREPLQRPR